MVCSSWIFKFLLVLIVGFWCLIFLVARQKSNLFLYCWRRERDLKGFFQETLSNLGDNYWGSPLAYFSFRLILGFCFVDCRNFGWRRPAVEFVC